MKNLKKILANSRVCEQVVISKAVSGARGFTCDYYFTIDPSEINAALVKDIINIFRKEMSQGFMLKVYYDVDSYRVWDNLELKWVEKIIEKELANEFPYDKVKDQEFTIEVNIDECTVSFGLNDGSIDEIIHDYKDYSNEDE